MACKTAEDLMKLARREGYDMTKEDAETYLVEMADVELTDEELKRAAGGVGWNGGGCPLYSGRW